MNTCPLFNKCGGCKFDFTSDTYRAEKLALLKNLPITNDPIWMPGGIRLRADLSYADGRFGFFESGSKNIVLVKYCPALTPALNKIIPAVSDMPWVGGGGVLITECDNGIDVAITSSVPYFTAEFKKAAESIPAIRVTWNAKVVTQTVAPIIKFDKIAIDYPTGAFLQPSKQGEDVLRQLVILHATGATKVADLFSGLGNFTDALNADGFDIIGNKIKRDLFKKPLTIQNLKKYDCVVMDPPRAGAFEQSKVLAKSNVARIIYISCNPQSFMRDKTILEKGGYILQSLTPVDQFVGSSHWELVGLFTKQSA